MLDIVTKFGVSSRIFVIAHNIKVNENSSSGNRVDSCGERGRPTDMAKLIGASRAYAKSPKNSSLTALLHSCSGL